MSATSEPSPESLAAENQRLRQALAEATAQSAALETRIRDLESIRRDLESIRRDLEHQVALFKRCLFGSRSEKVSAEELEARIAEHAREALQEAAQARRPDDPPPEAEEEQPEEPPAPAEGSQQESTLASRSDRRKARPHGRAPLPAHLRISATS